MSSKESHFSRFTRAPLGRSSSCSGHGGDGGSRACAEGRAGHRAALGAPLCRAAHSTPHTEMFIAAGALQLSDNSRESKHRGKAPASRAGTPPPTGKSALSAVEKLPLPPPTHAPRSKKPLSFSAILEEEIFVARRFGSTLRAS